MMRKINYPPGSIKTMAEIHRAYSESGKLWMVDNDGDVLWVKFPEPRYGDHRECDDYASVQKYGRRDFMKGSFVGRGDCTWFTFQNYWYACVYAGQVRKRRSR